MLSDVELVPVQREAVTHRGGPLLVLGAAGAGKTAVIEARFRWLADSGSRVERIAVVVPSRARADALRARLESGLDRGYEELFVLDPVGLAAVILGASGAGSRVLDSVLDPGARLAMLRERIDKLSLERHDFGGSATALLGGFIRRIDRLKAHLIGAEEYAAWASGLDQDAIEREFAQIYRTHERMLAQAG